MRDHTSMFLVCGEALFDVFIDDDGDCADCTMQARAGGSPFNVAIGLARLGQRAALLTGISHDALGLRLRHTLNKEGVANNYLLATNRPTAIVMVSLDTHGVPHYTFYGRHAADTGICIDDLPDIPPEITGVHFGSYALVVPPVADAFAVMLDRIGDRFISFDPNVRLTIEPNIDVWRTRFWQYAACADMIKISAEDMHALFPERAHEQVVEEMITAGAQLVVVTDVGKQARCWSAQGMSARRLVDPVAVVDTVGAGDTFQAALLMKLLQWGDMKQRIRTLTHNDLDTLLTFATKAAAITCSRQDANLPRLDDLS